MFQLTCISQYKLRVPVLACVALLLVLCVSVERVQGQLEWIRVNPATQLFVDALGRTRLFHGVNAVYKVFPWLPSNGAFDPTTSLGPEDGALLASWGLNVVRLGVMWPGVQPDSPDARNASYLAAARATADMLAAHGIYTIVDLHQDLFSRKFCGEGVPDWAVQPDAALPQFALPVASPPLPLDPLSPNGSYPLLDACLQRPFGLYYASQQVGAAFQRLYDDAGGLQQQLADGYWRAVAAAFADAPHVLGLELLNEPWPGDAYAYPELLLPGVSDRRLLSPMYQRLHAAIRQADDRHVLFFEDALVDLAYRTGFTPALTPGGEAYQDRQALSYHTYCGPLDAQGDPRSSGECDVEDDYFIDMAMADVRRVGSGAMMTEFGAVTNSSTGVAEIEWLARLADRHLQSWAYWQYKSYHDITTSNDGPGESLFGADGRPETNKVRALSRTYAQAVAGTPLEQRFDPASAQFSLQYLLDPAVAAPTVVYYNPQLYYPQGIVTALSTNATLADAPLAVSPVGATLLEIALTQPWNQTLLVTFKLSPK